MKTSRRNWIASTAAASVSLSALSWRSLARGVSPNNLIRIGVIGSGVRGKYLIGNLPSGARVDAICDCATSRMVDTLSPQNEFREVLASFRDQQARHCRTFVDYRQMLEQVPLDAVIIATPDHHHVHAAMSALQAGLHVYLEKPISVSIHEGRLLADAVKKTGRVLEVGSQQRSMEMNRFACEFVRDGGLGEISRVEFPNYPGPLPTTTLNEEPLPDGLNWDLFLGPAPYRPHHRQLWVKDEFKVDGRLWRGWDLFQDFSGHLMTNWGAHSIDMVQYALGMDHTGPVKITPIVDRDPKLLEEDWRKSWSAKTAPARSWQLASDSDARFLSVTMEYKSGTTLELVPGVNQATFYGTRGTMRISRNRYQCTPSELITNAPDEAASKLWNGQGNVARPHLENWLDAIRGDAALAAPVEVGHRTVTVCHLVNLARQLRRTLHWDPVKEQFVDDPIANQQLSRPRRLGYELPII